MRCASSSLRSAFVRPHAADFDAPYTASCGRFIQLAIDSTLTIAPPPFAASTGANARVANRMPKKLTSR